MVVSADTLIVGAGLAGACAALHLSHSQRVLLLEAKHPASGASGAAAGLVNPLMGRRAKPVWRMDEALRALHETFILAKAAPLFDPGGLLRPVVRARQAEDFRHVASNHPDQATWLQAEAVERRFPEVVFHDGALLVRRGGAVQVPAFVEALLAAAKAQGTSVRLGTQVTGWDERHDIAWVHTETGEHFAARRVLLALGYGFRHFPELARLNLHGIKGQTVRITTPSGLHLPMPLSGHGYVVPQGEMLVVGSSYEHTFDDLAPSPAANRAILRKAARMLPALHDATALDAVAGVRVTVPGTRLPMLGPLPGRSRIWLFTGLGSKGLLMAPLLARNLARFVRHPDTIPPAVRVH